MVNFCARYFSVLFRSPCWFIFLLANLLSQQVFAGNYQLDKLADLSSVATNDKPWSQLLINPNNKNQYFLVNDQSQIFISNDNVIQSEAILDLMASTENSDFNQQITAITLHPDFSDRDKSGYGTFFTAHTQAYQREQTSNRLHGANDNQEYVFDNIVNQWTLFFSNKFQVDINAKREILRIATKDAGSTISQLAFNTHTSDWASDDNLLYIAFNQDQQLRQYPLYSGTLLRINPQKFALLNYTVPDDNPFTRNNDINDEIYILGVPYIKQVIWSKQDSRYLFIRHQLNTQQYLIQAEAKDDFRLQTTPESIWQHPQPIADNAFLHYQGRSFKNLYNKLLFLSTDEQQWLLSSFNFSTQSNSPKQTLKWQITDSELDQTSKLSLHQNLEGELIIYDQTTNALYQLYQLAPQVTDQQAGSPVPESSLLTRNKLFFIIAVTVMFFAVALRYRRNRYSPSFSSAEQYFHLEISKSKQQIGLYRRRQTNTDTVINISDLHSSKVMLNDEQINLITNEANNVFNQVQQTKLVQCLTGELKEKMLDNNVRQINLVLTDKQQKQYVVCLYLRSGNKRLTKNSYQYVVDDIINWCWLFSKHINPFHTEDRQQQEPLQAKSQQKKSEHKVISSGNQHIDLAEPSAKHNVITNNNHVSSDKNTTDSSEYHKAQTDTHLVENIQNDSELVNALAKLVTLRQDGFLTSDEFYRAKQKLLRDLLAP